MKDVTINTTVYTLDELPQKLQDKLRSHFVESEVELQFDLFGYDIYEFLLDDLGLGKKENNVRFQYDLSYCQGDGLSFNCDNFLSEKVLKMIKEKLTTGEKMQLSNLIKNYSFSVYTKRAGNHHYSYHTRHDVDHDADYSTPERYNGLIEKVLEICRDIYCNECSALEKRGYACYEISDEYMKEYFDEKLFFDDGRIYEEAA